MFDINLESMQAVIQSRLGKALDALWQEVIDYRDSNLSDVSYKNKLIAIRNYFEKNTIPKFKEIVWKFVGLHIESVIVRDTFSTGSFCTWMFIDKEAGRQNGSLQIESVLNADYIYKNFPMFRQFLSNNKPFTAADLLKIANAFDKESGGIRVAVRSEMMKWLNAGIGFDVTLAFMIEDQLPPKSGVSNLTAREITAVMLHDIGHSLTLIEHAADCYARTSTFKYLEAAFINVNKNNPEEVKLLAQEVANKISAIDKTTADQLRATAEKIDDDIKRTDKSTDIVTRGRVSKILTGFVEVMFGLLSDITTGNIQSNRFASTYSDQHRKLSDIPVNGRLATWMERKADEFAMAHGYGAEIVSALDIMTKFLARRGLTEKAIANLNDIESHGKIFRLFTAIRLVALLPTIASDYSYSLYPAGVKRYKEVLAITIQKLKQYGTNSEYIAKYIKDCDRIIEIISKPSSEDELTAKFYRAYDLFLKYCSLPSFVDWILHGRVRRELEDLVNDVEATGNSLLTYYGHKLQQLTN